MFDFEVLLMIDEEELFEDRRLYESDKNAFTLECERIKAEAIAKGMTDEEIKDVEFGIRMEIQDRLEIIELTYQLVDEFLLVLLSRDLGIQSDIADYLGSAFDNGVIPFMSDYNSN
ncbi:MAG: hypothetical protein ACLFPU_10810 [Dehalococcoidia bacterium]